MSANTDPPQLTVIFVSWNVADLLLRAIASVFASWGSADALEVIVVDNASQDGTVAAIRQRFPEVRLIVNDTNRGFTAANNQALEVARGDYLLLLNPDTEVLGDALPTLLGYMEAHPDVGLVGPQLLNPDGSVQSSRRRFPTLGLLFLESTWLQGLAPRRWLARYYVRDRADDEEQDVDWVTGAAMLIRRSVLAQVGPLDERFFMYSEEVDWCRRIKLAGWRIAYLPGAQVIHHEGQSSQQVVPARHIYFQSSKILYTRKVFGTAAAEALRLWLLLQYAWQIGLEGGKWLIGHKRPLRRSRIAAYVHIMRSGLGAAGAAHRE